MTFGKKADRVLNTSCFLEKRRCRAVALTAPEIHSHDKLKDHKGKDFRVRRCYNQLCISLKDIHMRNVKAKLRSHCGITNGFGGMCVTL